MKTRSSAHVHTQFCDGKSTAAEMAQSAYEKGFVSLGFSSHATQQYQLNHDFDDHYSMHPENLDAYKAEIRSLQRQYEGKMKIYLGVERDYYSALPPDDFDFYLAAVHHLSLSDHCYPAVDGSPEELKMYVEKACGGNGLILAKKYYNMLAEYVCKMKAPIIAHVDLIRKNNASLHLFDENGKEYQRIALDALAAMRESGAILEVNTGAIGRGILPTPYPAPFLLKKWRELGGEVMLNSDCHSADKIDVYFDEAEQLMRAAGFDHAVRLGVNSLWERYEL